MELLELSQQGKIELEVQRMNAQITLDLQTTLTTGLTDLWNAHAESRMANIDEIYDAEVDTAKKNIKNERLLAIELDKIEKRRKVAETEAHNKKIDMQILSSLADSAVAGFKIYAEMAPGMANPLTTALYTPLFVKSMMVLAIKSALAIATLSTQKAEFGADFTTSGPQMLMVGDNPGGRERVQVTPIGSPNLDGPTGGGITVNISGNVMSQDFIEDEAIPMIKDALRRGGDIGIT